MQLLYSSQADKRQHKLLSILAEIAADREDRGELKIKVATPGFTLTNVRYLGNEALHRQGCSDFRYCTFRHILIRLGYVVSCFLTTTILVGTLSVTYVADTKPSDLTVARRLRIRKGCKTLPLQSNSFSSWCTFAFEEARPHEDYWSRNKSSKAQNQKRQESFAAARAQVGKLLLQ